MRVDGAMDLAKKMIEGSSQEEMRNMLKTRLKNDKVASDLLVGISDDKIEDCLLDTMANDLLKLQDDRAKRVEINPEFSDKDTEDSLHLLAAYGFDTSGETASGKRSIFGSDKLRIFAFVFCIVSILAYINLSSSPLAVNIRRTFFEGYKGDPSKLKPKPILPHEEGYNGFSTADAFDAAIMKKIEQIKRKEEQSSSSIDLDDFNTADNRYTTVNNDFDNEF